MFKSEFQEWNVKGGIRIYLENAKKRNPHVSLRSLAKALKINPTSLSLFLNGKRDLSPATCKRLLERLIAEKSIRDESEILELARSRHEYVAPTDSDYIALISDWIPLAILALFETEGVKSDGKWIAKKMHLPVKKVNDAIVLLKRVNLLKANPDGQLKPTGGKVSGGSVNPSKFIRRAQFSCFARSQWTQNRIEEGARSTLPINYSMIITAADPANVAKVRDEIIRFRRRMEKLLENGNKKEVYLLGIDLLPLTTEFVAATESSKTSR